jgi:hypothetical protein
MFSHRLGGPIEQLKNENRESDGSLNLSGHHQMGGHNNQPIVSVSGSGVIREEMQPGWNVWGGVVSSFQVVN